jgi:hypothetical protein
MWHDIEKARPHRPGFLVFGWRGLGGLGPPLGGRELTKGCFFPNSLEKNRGNSYSVGPRFDPYMAHQGIKKELVLKD